MTHHTGSRRESDIKQQILADLGGDSRYLIWNNPSGTAITENRVIRYGLPGSPDVIGVVSVTITPSMVGQRVGLFLGIETKSLTATGRIHGHHDPKQQAFQRRCESLGGLYVLAPASGDDIREAVSRLCP